jgi:hypothetical protein
VASLRVAAARPGLSSLSVCALDHLSAVRALTPAQLAARYPHACAERWGGARGRHTHGGQPGVPLGARLAPCGLLSAGGTDACDACSGDGASFFSFCLNRPVNGDRVIHCMDCGRCSYFRPGFPSRRCPYCLSCPSQDGDDDSDGNDDSVDEDDSDDEETARTEMRFAAEGYWGY